MGVKEFLHCDVHATRLVIDLQCLVQPEEVEALQIFLVIGTSHRTLQETDEQNTEHSLTERNLRTFHGTQPQ